MSDNRRDQLIEFVEREFIGPDPIDWPGMTQSNGQEILASDPPRTRYIAGILYPAETTNDKADLKDDECELLGESDGEDVEVKPQKLGDGTVEFLEDAEELINRSNAYRQSAISITVSVKDGDAIRVAVSAGTYTKVPAMDPATGERLENKYKYPRTALAWKNDNAPLILPTPTDGLKKFPIGTTGLQFDITYGAKAMRVDSEKDRDPYWTNMGYYNSIRELGQAATWIRADIDQHLDVMYKRRFEDKRYPTKEEYRKNRRYIWRDEELTSRISGSEVTASLANLGIRYPGEVDSEGKIKEHPIDICLATNMISVGLDVSRLGLMTVAGQPKTTSEYIQATSRVGRDAENAPGLVFVLYRPGRPRDKSHYEQFRSYHSRVYCNVEPTSVTPFSAPVRERALHAIMVGMMRLESDDRFNEDPPRFPDDGLIDKVRSVIENRVDDIDSEELDATLNRMEYILQCWEDWNPRKWEPAKNPDWSYADPVPLMYSAGSHPNEAWGSRGIETPTSMRSVDASCEAEVLTNRYVPKEG